MQKKLHVISLAVIATFATIVPGHGQSVDRAVALTFDDLPMTLVDGACDPAVTREVTAKLLAGLDRAAAPATGFVNAKRTCGVDAGELRDPVLEAWLDAGHALGNHTWSHPDLEHTSLEAYLEDARKGGAAVDSLLGERGETLVWFRHPLLHAGDTPRKKAGLSRFLDDRGWRVAPVTVDNQEWVYAYVYHAARERGDDPLADRAARAYLRHLEGAFAYFERRSREVVGREFPQVLLLHANRLNADHVDAVIELIRSRGYRERRRARTRPTSGGIRGRAPAARPGSSAGRSPAGARRDRDRASKRG